jgi:FPC/CPF motif-containing protein YcgG
MSIPKTDGMTPQVIIDEYKSFLESKGFPCIAAKAAVARDQVKCLVASDMAQSNDDENILRFMYEFVDYYRSSSRPFNSAAVIFEEPKDLSEDSFDDLLWERLNSLTLLDKRHYAYDKRVDPDPQSSKFSFSLKEEAFFIIGLHPASNRRARRFTFPTLVFNPHEEFERLRRLDRYEEMRHVVRRRDTKFSGSVNPVLTDFGEEPEVFQYSGLQHDPNWKCPLHRRS